MTFAELKVGQEFKIVPMRAGGWLPGTWRKVNGIMCNAVDVADKHHKASIGAGTKVIPTGEGQS